MTQRTRPATNVHDWDWGRVRDVCLRETRRVLGNASPAADDAAQDATIRAWRPRGRCRTPSRPEPWVATIARREALRVLAQRSELSSGSHEIADTRQDLGDLAGSLDVRRAVRAMDSQDRRLLVGHYWQDLSNSELAMQLGLAEVTVRVRLHRLRRQLRDILVEA
jgi:RNA polymerase sigma factor (sigma-70 family)